MKVRVLWIYLVVATLGCTPERDPRTAEIWIVDFQTYGDEVSQTIDGLGFDEAVVIERTLAHLEEFFEELPITFEAGTTPGGLLKSSICVRHGDGARFGRGFLNFDNTHAVHDCGEPDGTEHGAFINKIADVFRPQVSGKGFKLDAQTDMFAMLLAVVLAHEIGHGIGLEHSDRDYGPGDIMKALPSFDIYETYYFPTDHRGQLAQALLFGG